MAQAQDAPASIAAIATDQAAPAPAASVRPFDLSAGLFASETYASNASGLSVGSRSDFISTIGFNASIHDRTRVLAFDANYRFGASFYTNGTQSSQITNNLEAVGTVAAIPDHLFINAKAFAAPVVVSNAGITTAGNRVVSNGFRNSYGYYVEPDLRFRLGEFATSETAVTYGSTYFTSPAGSVPIGPIPGLAGPQDTNSRSAAQTFSSGEDFGRLNWTLIGSFSETERRQGLLTEKAGVANFGYALSRELSLLGTVGYEAITATTLLTRNVSGLVALGGFSWTAGADFSLSVQAGRKFNSASYLGSLRYNLSPKTALVAAADDTVTTPEGQLLNRLTHLVSTPEGSLTTSDNLLGDGTPASLPTFSTLPLANFGFDQNISRYQTVSVSFLEDFERNHAAVTLYAARRTILGGVFIGPPVTESWGGQVTYSRNISPRTVGTAGAGYSEDEQLGGTARSLRLNAEVAYAVSREMQLYMRANYLDRRSSAVLSALSPFTGSLSDYEITIGVSRAL